MMINKRLINTVKESKKYIILNVIFQWLTLLANIIMMFSLARFIERVFLKNATIDVFINTAIIVLITIIVRSIFTILANRMSFQSSKTVKKKLRTMIYDKLLKIGLSYKEKIKTSEVVQVAVEGVEQLETYFGAYLPQFFLCYDSSNNIIYCNKFYQCCCSRNIIDLCTIDSYFYCDSTNMGKEIII